MCVLVRHTTKKKRESLTCCRFFMAHKSDTKSNHNLSLTRFPSTVSVTYSEVTVTYIRGLPNVVCPLPSRNEKCQFVLRPVSHNVGDFLEMLKSEDRGIDRAAILNKNGVRIASSCSIESLMDESFW